MKYCCIWFVEVRWLQIFKTSILVMTTLFRLCLNLFSRHFCFSFVISVNHNEAWHVKVSKYSKTMQRQSICMLVQQLNVTVLPYQPPPPYQTRIVLINDISANTIIEYVIYRYSGINKYNRAVDYYTYSVYWCYFVFITLTI